MNLAFWIGTAVLATAPVVVEQEHAENAVYRGLTGQGVALGGETTRFPLPVLRDGMSADQQRAALKGVAGSEGKLEDLLRDSVTAPFILKLHDRKTSDGTTIRGADLWFVVRADLDAIDPARIARQRSDGKPVEAGNMRFESRRLDPEKKTNEREWLIHLTGRLLDRIHVEATDRAVASKANESWVIAARTDPQFATDAKAPNRWWPIARVGGRETPGKAEPYAGGASYAKISRLKLAPGALLVETHFAFAEPFAWFDGAPILRSKIAVVAQDQIRRLRRELAEKRKEDP